ncbi:hypothetical protein BCV70DRAFT_198460 [Testicularia cyperi]|uniref:Ubiquitin-like domain-containing protein n=1 Tax=Testicularia cyperi TaxID=1882483 RepID=A0A317XW97_9BASI|nr:hypothetical protein BCV70DRAFT_198460 [Testicularia cyperi]
MMAFANRSGARSGEVELEIHLRVRPVSIRFTEPGVSDLPLDIVALTSIHDQRSPPNLLFDYENESPPTTDKGKGKGKGKARAPNSSEDHTQGSLSRDWDGDGDDTDSIKSAMQHSLAEQTIREIKRRVRYERPSLERRRLRLIHSGRILRDGIRLVSWLDGLDEHRRLQSKTLRDLALDAASSSGSDDSSDDQDADHDGRDEDRDETEKEVLTFQELVELVGAEADSSPIDAFASRQASGKGKGKQRQPYWYTTPLRVIKRTAPRIYLQCSVGDLLQEGEEDLGMPPVLSEVQQPQQRPGGTDASTWNSATNPFADGEADADAEPGATYESARGGAERGFDRLLSAGLSADEIQAMREQFRSSIPMSGDVLRQQEEQEHLIAMEDQWMESFDLPSASSSSYHTVLEGLMAGFFLPLAPLFFFRHDANPSSFPHNTPAPQDDNFDDQDAYLLEQAATSNATFSKTMQISILFGLLANLLMGTFRLIW